MTARTGSTASVPWTVSVFSPILRLLLAARIPLGPNRLVTIRGRSSGQPRTLPLAVVEFSGRRFVWSPWGEVHWVRNLRAAGHASISLHGRQEDFYATELDLPQRIGFFRDVLAPLARSIPFGMAFVRIVDGVDLRHPVDVAAERRVFELHSVDR